VLDRRSVEPLPSSLQYDIIGSMFGLAVNWDAVSSVSTALAVGVALLLPFYLEHWRTRRTQPTITLRVDTGGAALRRGDEAVDVILLVFNERGRHRAESVEIVATARHMVDGYRFGEGVQQSRS